MNHLSHLRLLAPLALSALVTAQFQEGLISFSQPENTLSGSGATVLGQLRPNETAVLQWGATTACLGLSAEKWAPRTCYHTMAGDEDANAVYFNPTIFGSIDALVESIPTTGTGLQNQRTVFWSVDAAMGTNVAINPFRPGDVARIVRAGPGDGQVQYFMRQEQFNMALGLPLATPIDVDAIAFSPQFGVFFSLDADIVCNTACGVMLVQDGDVVVVPPSALTYTPDMRISGVAANSAIVVLTEAQIDAMVINALVTNRFGVCLPNAVDLESLEFDMSSATQTYTGCTAGIVVFSSQLIFSVETGTGASLLTTGGGGSIWNGPCTPMGTPCASGPTLGNQSGLRPTAPGLGVPSYVNAFTLAHTNRYVLEPQNHVLNVFPGGAAAGSTMVDVGSPFPWNFIFIELVGPVVPTSLPAFPFSQQFFPDVYVPSLSFYLPTPTIGGFATFPMPPIPPFWTGKVLFQSLAFGSSSNLELSTPTVIDVQ
jgi:hypothetical protein